MAKQIEKVLKLQIRGGAANPAPPVGPALGWGKSRLANWLYE